MYMVTSDAGKEEIVAVRLAVHGRVQGVGFRHFTRLTAQRYSVTGWVRNEYDGSVVIWAQGTRRAVAAFIEAIQPGPSGAWVTDIDTVWFAPDETLRQFTVRY